MAVILSPPIQSMPIYHSHHPTTIQSQPLLSDLASKILDIFTHRMSNLELENPFDAEDDPADHLNWEIRHHRPADIHFGPDPRFISSMDQTRWCFVLFNNYNRCVEKLGEDAERCKYLYHKFRTVTPNFIKDRWEDELSEGRFAGYDPNYKVPEIVVDYSLRPSRTRHLEKKHDEHH